MRTRKENGEGSCRKLGKDEWECVIQSKYINPKTMKPKRVKRKGKNEKQARENAQMALLAWEKQFINYDLDVKVDKSKTFGEYMQDYMENDIRKRVQSGTYHSYYRSFQNYFLKFKISKMQLNMLNVKVFEEYYEEINSMYSLKTCKTPIQWCRQLCRKLVDESLLKENYAQQAKIRLEVIDEYDKERAKREEQRKKIFTLEDVQKFYESYKKHYGEYSVVVMFLLESGLRCQEFASITNDNIDFENRTILIEKSRAIRFKDDTNVNGGVEYYTKVPKNKKGRIIYMSDLCMECVKEMQEQTRLHCPNNRGNYLYPTFRSGNPRSSSSMETCFKNLCNKLEIDRGVYITRQGNKKGLCLHSLRDTMSSLSKSRGSSTSSVALMLGHSELVNDKNYTFANVDVLKEIKTPSQILEDDKKDKELWEEFLEYKKWKESQNS